MEHLYLTVVLQAEQHSYKVESPFVIWYLPITEFEILKQHKSSVLRDILTGVKILLFTKRTNFWLLQNIVKYHKDILLIE